MMLATLEEGGAGGLLELEDLCCAARDVVPTTFLEATTGVLEGGCMSEEGGD